MAASSPIPFLWVLLCACAPAAAWAAEPPEAPKWIKKQVGELEAVTRFVNPGVNHVSEARRYLERLSRCARADERARTAVTEKRDRLLRKFRAQASARSTPGKIRRLIASLNVPDKSERKNAADQLYAIGETALPYTRQALRDATDPDTAARLRELVSAFDGSRTHSVLTRCLEDSIETYYSVYLERAFPTARAGGCRRGDK